MRGAPQVFFDALWILPIRSVRRPSAMARSDGGRAVHAWNPLRDTPKTRAIICTGKTARFEVFELMTSSSRARPVRTRPQPLRVCRAPCATDGSPCEDSEAPRGEVRDELRVPRVPFRPPGPGELKHLDQVPGQSVELVAALAKGGELV